MAWETLGPGVYECRRGTDCIRIVVAGQLPRTENNAMLHLFSASAEQLGYGTAHYRQRSAETSTLLHRLLRGYQQEGIAMSYTMQDFRRDYIKDFFKDLTPEERHEAMKALTADDLLAVLSPEQIEQLREKLNAERPAAPPKKRRK